MITLIWVDGVYACERCGNRYLTRVPLDAGKLVPLNGLPGDLGPARCVADGGRFVLVPPDEIADNGLRPIWHHRPDTDG
jgi:hypothetical protein